MTLPEGAGPQIHEGEEMEEATPYEELNDILERILDDDPKDWREKAQNVLVNVSPSVLTEFLTWFEPDEDGDPTIADEE